jgi:hypothetical protein
MPENCNVLPKASNGSSLSAVMICPPCLNDSRKFLRKLDVDLAAFVKTLSLRGASRQMDRSPHLARKLILL